MEPTKNPTWIRSGSSAPRTFGAAILHVCNTARVDDEKADVQDIPIDIEAPSY